MSRTIRRRRSIILVIAALALVFATGAYVAMPKGIAQLDLLTSSGETVGESIEVYVGTETHLSCRITPAFFTNRDVRYTISDENIAAIDEEGLLKALKEGETRLTLECAGTRKNYTVKVNIAVKDIKGLDEEITLYEGEDFQLEPEIVMAEKDLKKPEITYETKRNTIANVDSKGLITAVQEGETTITVTAGDVTKKVKIIVEASPIVTSAPTVTSTTNTDNNRNGTSGRTTRKTRRNTDNSSGSSNANSGGKSGGSGSTNKGSNNSGSGNAGSESSNSSGGDSGSSGSGSESGGNSGGDSGSSGSGSGSDSGSGSTSGGSDSGSNSGSDSGSGNTSGESDSANNGSDE